MDNTSSIIMTMEKATISLGFFRARKREKWLIQQQKIKPFFFLQTFRSETIYSSTWSWIFLSRDVLNSAVSFSFRAVSFNT